MVKGTNVEQTTLKSQTLISPFYTEREACTYIGPFMCLHNMQHMGVKRSVLMLHSEGNMQRSTSDHFFHMPSYL